MRERKGDRTLGYRKYAKDYEVEYVDRIGNKRPKAVRIYVGPYFRFRGTARDLRRLRIGYSVGVLLAALFLLIPLTVDTAATRTWYVQVPAAMAWIPWVLSAAALWRLWTAKEPVDREHYDMLYQRMCGACMGMMILEGISLLGCVLLLIKGGAGWTDALVLVCTAGTLLCGMGMFARRGGLRMDEVENPEKPQAKKK